MARTGQHDRKSLPGFVAGWLLVAMGLSSMPATAQTYPDPLVNTATVTAPGDTFDPATANNTGTDTNTLAAVAQLSVVKTLVTASPARVGEIVGYQIVVGNAGPSVAVGVLITDPAPPQLTSVTWSCVASSPASSCTASSGAGDISTTATIAVGDTLTFTVNGIAPLITPATIAANTVTLTPPPGTSDPTPGDDTSTVPPVPVVPKPIIANDDAGANIPGATGGIAVANVRGNDTLDGAGATAGDTALTVTVPPSSANITLDLATGEVVVAPATPAGNYSLTYELCETANPGNCDTAIVTVPVAAAAINAVDDVAGPIPGSGGAGVINVLTNDTSNAAPVIPADVVLTPANNGPITINPNGAVDVAPNTPAGPYVATYQICEVLNPANCDGATVTITVAAAAIDAVDDVGAAPVSGATGGTAVASVLGNDSLDGVAPTSATVTVSVTVPPATANITLDPASGAVNVAPNTPAGTYSLTYQICEQLNPANCDTATATLAVSAGAIAANDDDTAATPVGGVAGGTAVANVLANDSLDAAAPTAANVLLSVVVPPSSPNVALNLTTGAVTVAPNTPAGPYSLTYQICESLNPANCDTAIVTLAVSAAAIAANDDDASGTPIATATGGTAVANVLANDSLGGTSPTSATVTLTQVVAPTNPGVALNLATGAVTVAAGTPSGTYPLTYRICEQLNPANCDNAVVTVVVAPSVIAAVADTAGPINGLPGATAVVNVLANDTFDGAPATTAVVALAPVTSGPLTINADGTVDVAPNTPVGSYVANYQICDLLEPANCDGATVTVNVVAATIDAINDDFSAAPVNGSAGGTTASVLGNDTLNGAAIVPAAVVLTTGALPPGITINPGGTVSIAPNTPAATVVIAYQICEQLNPANCDSATATIAVAAAVIDAVDDVAPAPIPGTAGGQAIANVLGNDTLNAAAVALPAVILSQISTTQANVTLDTATGAVAVAPNTPAGTFSLVYRICSSLNPASCDQATATVAVSAAGIDAINDDFSATPINGSVGGTTPSVLLNDTLDGAVATPATITLTSGALPPGVTLNANGTVTIAPNTPAATLVITYQICEQLNPGNCDSATATITVAPGLIDAINDDFTAAPINGNTGGTTPSVLANDTLDGAPVAPAGIVLTSTSLPPGFALGADGTVTVPANTPAGNYPVGYRLCEALNPANCDTAVATIAVAAAVIDAVDDDFSATPIAGASGGNTASILVNDTLGGAPVALAAITLAATALPAGFTLNPDGTVAVASNTPAGNYSVGYRLCEILNPANCDTATATVVVAAPPIDAVDDSVGPINGAIGGSAVANVLGNDSFNGAALNPADIVLTPVANGPVSVRADGAVDVAPGTPAGSYSVTYQICDQINPTNCDSATVTVSVIAATIAANDDTGTAAQNTPVTTIVLSNDTMNGQPMVPGQIVVTVSTPPTRGTTVVDANGGVVYTPAGNFSGADTYAYTACEIINPNNCATANVTITVLPNAVSANDDSAQAQRVTPLVIPVLVNDTVTGAPLDPVSLAVTGPPVNGTATCSAGACTYTANADFTGTDTFSYQVCDVSVPTPVCDTAVVTVAVVGDAVSLRLTKRAAQATARIGDLVRYTVLVENVGQVPAVNASIVDTLPTGFSYVDNSLLVLDDNQGGSLASTNPLRIDGIDIAVGGTATISYSLRVGAGAGIGTHTNRVVGHDDEDNTLSNVATADVEVVGDPLLDDSLILGSVFDDRDGDGRQGPGERGIPGVRIGSAEGLLVETDSYGRFHLVGIDGGGARGRNFILKVDPATLPAGARFTTENPRVRRLTPGLPVRFDFGIDVPATTLGGGKGMAQADVELGEVLFAGASAVVRDDYAPMFDRIAATLRDHGGGRVTIAATADAEALAFERARSVQKTLVSRMDAMLADKVTVDVVTSVDPTQRLLSLDRAIGLSGVLFDTDRATIRRQFKPLIAEIARQIEAQGHGELEIVGHADYRGSIDHNRVLGLRRAEAVFKALAAQLSPAVRERLHVEARPASQVGTTTGDKP